MAAAAADDRSAPLSLALITFDLCAAMCGLCSALLLAGELDPAHVAGTAAVAVPLLLSIRLAVATGFGVYRPPPRERPQGHAGRLVLSMVGGSVVFALVLQDLPRSVYALEFFVTGTLTYAGRVLARPVECPRRALNIAVALIGMALTAPLWIAIAVLVKVTSRGPVFYAQERVGLDVRHTRALEHDPRRKVDLGGRPFMMYKFRTMRQDAESETGAVWCTKDDPRVTSVGRFLRHTRLDELPQLINVLKGDMNVVGPRPERPSIFAELRTKIPNYDMRQRTRPGITGYAQVNLEYDSSVDDVIAKVAYDLQYLARQSVAMDLQIMAKTVPVMLFRDKVLAGAMRAAEGPTDDEDSTRASPASAPHGSTSLRRGAAPHATRCDPC